MIREIDKLISFINIVKTKTLLKRDDLFNIKEWTRKNIMKKTNDFINYLEKLTDLETVIAQLEKQENMFHIEIKEPRDNNLIKNLTDLMLGILEDFPKEEYQEWKTELIKQYVDLMLKQIKEDRDTKDIKHRVFKRERVCYNFVLEHIYSLNRNDKDITLINLTYKLKKKDYLNQLNLYFNMLLIIQFAYICNGLSFEGNIRLTDSTNQTTQQLIKNAYNVRSKQTWNCLYNNLLEMIYSLVWFLEGEE